MSDGQAMANFESIDFFIEHPCHPGGGACVVGIRDEFEPVVCEVSMACASPDDMGEPYVFLDFTDTSGDRACGNFSPGAARALAAQLLKAARWAEGDRT